jgi:hypothetical protein
MATENNQQWQLLVVATRLVRQGVAVRQSCKAIFCVPVEIRQHRDKIPQRHGVADIVAKSTRLQPIA